MGDRKVDKGGEDVGPVEDRQVGADPLRCRKRHVQHLGIGVGQLEGAVEAGGELVAPEAEGGGAGAPAVEQLVDGDVLFGGPGLEHDPVELLQAGVAADGVFELAEGVVDLAAPLGELRVAPDRGFRRSPSRRCGRVASGPRGCG